VQSRSCGLFTASGRMAWAASSSFLNSIEAYLAWRGETGDTAMFREMLVKPMEVRYYDEVFVTTA
jgi:hypothetical protein